MNTDSLSQSELRESDSIVALLNKPVAGSSEGLQNPSAAAYKSDFLFSAHDSPDFGDNLSLMHGPAVSEPHQGGPSEGLEGSAKASASDDVPAARADYNKALFEARMSTIGDAAIKMPWETGIMKQIFDSDDDSVFPTVVPPVPAEYFAIPPGAVDEQTGQGSAADVPTAQSLVRDDIALPFYSFAVKVLPDRDIFAEDSLLWDKALQKWLQVFEVLGFPGTLGFSLLAEQAHGATGTQSDALRDSLGIKSPRTALKRAQTLLRYFAWLQTQSADWEPWDRSWCLKYLGAVGSHGVPASKGTTLLEALRFSKYVLGVPIPEGLISDPQLRGRAQRLMASKAIYKPARPLKAKELAALEEAMASDLDVRDIYMLGAIIFAVLSRSRWSDLRFVDQFWVERAEFNGQPFGFVEVRTKFHKTATSLAKKQRHMPLVAPLLGVTDVDWSKHWLAAMQELNVDVFHEPFGAICRAPAHDGSLCRRSCTTEEIGNFANKFLKTAGESAISSHSFKHTTLAWCSAYGLDEPSRTLLGHHELQGAKAMAVYSRDMLTRPLQLYCSMLANIRQDHFRPDESRTSRMMDLMKIADTAAVPIGRQVGAPTLQPATGEVGDDGEASCVPTTPLEQEPQGADAVDVADDESSEIPSTSSSSSDSSDGDDAPAARNDIEGPVLRNRRSHVVHRCSQSTRSTACGRLVTSSNFELLEEGCSSLNARCGKCFKGEVISSVGELVSALDQQRAKRPRR